MPFEKRGDEILDAVINVRLTKTEKARLIEDADLAALSMSELVRRRYFGRPILANADQAMIRELRRLGGLLKYLHNETGGVLHRDTAGVLAALKAYIERLSHDRQKN
ncbi:MobB mobilization protein [Duganella sp. FT135W]|uniref:MobB mobilization protein n=1 Tax=Duganella flavida TaxID=2692175 RepID=A0A6L8KAT0_9BURK|nr:MobB mobilization protein [Duganella flavida]MYM21471.1 MobB mobilization protein [Duganella flavida]